MTWGGHLGPSVTPPRRAVLAPAIVLFTIMVGHTMLETARDALFLAKLGPDDLAWVYIAMAAFALIAYVALGKWSRHADPRRMLLWFLVTAAAGTGVLAVTLRLAPWLVFALYIWAGLVATMVVPTFWTLLDRSLRLAEAKRVFASIGAGGVFGAMVGSGSAALLGRVMPAGYLVFAAAGLYALAAVLAFVLVPRETRANPPHAVTEAPAPAPDPAVPPPARRYLRVLIALGVASTIGLTLGDLVFKRALAERLPATELAAAFGTIYAGLNAMGLVFQLLVTPRLLARWGVGGALVILPMIMAASSFGFAATGAMVAIIALKLGDGSLRYSLHRVGTEILFLPVPTELRDRSKPIIDAIGLRGGQAVAALMVFALAQIGASARVSGAVAAAISAVWLIGAVVARRAYVDAFRGKLKASEVARDVRVPVPDADSLALLTDALASPDEVEALAALDVLARHRRVPALVLYHPAASVVHRALALLEGSLRPDIARVLRHSLDHADPEVRAAALAASSRTGTHRDRLVAALDDPEAAVRAVALVELSLDPTDGARARDGIDRLAAGSEADRLALAQAIGRAPHKRFKALLHGMLRRREPRVAREVLRAYTREPALADLSRVLALLADPHVRGDARRVLVAAGAPALERVTGALDDPRTPLDVRRQLPRTLGQFRSAPAATALVARLLREPDGTTEFKILRALGRLRERDHALPIDTVAVRMYVQRAVADAARYATFADLAAAEARPAGAEPSPGDDLLVTLLDEKRSAAIERAFRALGILEPSADLRTIHDALVGSDDSRSTAGEEIIEAMMPSELRVPLLASLRSVEPEVRRARLGALAPGPYDSHEAFAAALLQDPSESVRCVIAYHVAERKLAGLRTELVRLRPLAGSLLVMFAFDQAIARLDA